MVQRGPKTDKTGRSVSGDKFAKLFLKTMQCPAWRALSPYAQCLYPWLVLEWKGPNANNNGSISLPVREAAKKMGCNRETARKAFLDLQAKGFLVVTRCAALGTVGEATRHLYEITELGTGAKPIPRKKFRGWKSGHDFPVIKAATNNPRGIGGGKNLESQLTEWVETPRPQLTDRTTPNLQNRPNEAKTGDSLAHSVSHPYLPGGTGKRHVSQTADPAAHFIGKPVRFAVVLPCGAVRRVGVRTTIPQHDHHSPHQLSNHHQGD